MILFEGVRAKALPDTASGRTGALYKSLSFHLGAGCHAVVGADPAAARLLLDLASGRADARGGKVRVLEAAPSTSAVAARIAYVPKDVVLPESMTVKGVVELDIAVRGSRKTAGKNGDPTSRLATLDCAHLADRAVRTLTAQETRAVALAIALTSNADVVLVEEPFVGISGRAAPRLASAVHAFAGKSTMVLVTTASLHDAKLLGAQITSLSNERLVPRSYGASAAGSTEDVLFVVASDNMRLAAAIASEGVAQNLRVEHGALEIHTRDLESTASAIARAALHESLTIVSLSSESREGARVVERAASALSSLRPPALLVPGSEAIDPTLPPPARVPVDAVASPVSSSSSNPSEGS